MSKSEDGGTREPASGFLEAANAVEEARRQVDEAAAHGEQVARATAEQNAERRRVVEALGGLARRDEFGALLDLCVESNTEVAEVERLVALVSDSRFVRHFGQASLDLDDRHASDTAREALELIDRAAKDPHRDLQVGELAEMLLPLTRAIYEGARLDVETISAVQTLLDVSRKARDAAPVAERLATVLREFADQEEVLERMIESLDEQRAVAETFGNLAALLSQVELLAQKSDERERTISNRLESIMAAARDAHLL